MNEDVRNMDMNDLATRIIRFIGFSTKQSEDLTDIEAEEDELIELMKFPTEQTKLMLKDTISNYNSTIAICNNTEKEP